MEAKLQAKAIIEVVALALTGKDGNYGTTKDGKMYRRVSTKEGLTRMGVKL